MIHENCIECGTKLSGKQERYCSRKCCKLHGGNKHKHKTPNGKLCTVCNKELIGRQVSFCGGKCKSNGFYKSHPDNNTYTKQKDRGIIRKLQLIDARGGACENCGYNKNTAALTFHHINQNTKSFCLEMRQMATRPYNVLVSEANKCKLLCFNCHAETHYPTLNLESLRSLYQDQGSDH